MQKTEEFPYMIVIAFIDFVIKLCKKSEETANKFRSSPADSIYNQLLSLLLSWLKTNRFPSPQAVKFTIHSKKIRF